MTFLESMPPDGDGRDAFLLEQIAAGRLDPPTWIRVHVVSGIEVEVSADYLTIDGEHVPMTGAVAQAAVDSLDALLPTPAVVASIEQAATIVPMPTWAPPPGQDRGPQTSSAVIAWAEARTREAFARHHLRPSQLVAGHRKDVVLDAVMPEGFVVIFGAQWPDGRRLQSLYRGHGDWYEDYATGVRAVRRRCWIWGAEASLDALYERAPLGPVAKLRYPSRASTSTVPQPPEPPPSSSGPASAGTAPATTWPTLQQGASGPAVWRAQELLVAAGHAIDVDGIFGPQTGGAVIAFQRARNLALVDGVLGPSTWAALEQAPSPGGPVYPAEVAREIDLRPPLAEGDVDRVFGPLPWSPVPGDASAIAVPAAWRAEHLAVVTIPELVGIDGAPASGRVQFARAMADPLVALWAAWRAKGKLPLVRSFAGTVAFRRVRGGALPSRHARGLAFDLNVAWNPMGDRGAPRGATGSVCDLLEELPAHGFTTGGLYGRPDWMHIEALEVP